MSPSRAEGFWARLSSARDLFHSALKKNQLENRKFGIFYSFFFILFILVKNLTF
jgi:hypothetical protein